PPAEGLACNAPSCIAPVDPFAELAPLPLLVGAPARTEAPAAFAEREGLVLRPLAWTTPVELPAVFPPPSCAAPVEFVAVLLPDPPTDVGALTDAPAVDDPTPADGFTDVLPAWTVPVEPDALLSANPGPAEQSAIATSNAI